MPICPECRTGFDESQNCPTCGTYVEPVEGPINLERKSITVASRRCSKFGYVCLVAGWLLAVIGLGVGVWGVVTNAYEGFDLEEFLLGLVTVIGLLSACYLFWMAIKFAEGE